MIDNYNDSYSLKVYWVVFFEICFLRIRMLVFWFGGNIAICWLVNCKICMINVVCKK